MSRASFLPGTGRGNALRGGVVEVACREHSIRGGPPPSRAVRAPPPRAGEEQEEFGAGAVRLAGFCCLHFGWAPDAFWRATPAEVAAVVGVLVPDRAAPVTRGELSALEMSDG